jgi:hypothetical protein
MRSYGLALAAKPFLELRRRSTRALQALLLGRERLAQALDLVRPRVGVRARPGELGLDPFPLGTRRSALPLLLGLLALPRGGIS